MNRIHPLATTMDGCTHVEEGRHITTRYEDAQGSTSTRVRVELRGGIMVGGKFVPKRGGAFGLPTEWREHAIPDERDLDYMAFQAEFEADETQPLRSLEDRAHACRLEYLQRVQLGMRPMLEP